MLETISGNWENNPGYDLDNNEIMATGEEDISWPQQFVMFYSLNYSKFVRMAYFIVQSKEAAEDIVQDSFIKGAGIWDRVEVPEAFITKTVVNACNSYLRRLRIEKKFIWKQKTPERSPALVKSEIDLLLYKLPPKERVAIVLRFFADLPDKEIAHAIKCNPNSVSKIISRALEKLNKEVLQDEN
ncbi:MAG: sigma-70 family RNA polymerase sigma factor [Acidimicrobiales bacterium]|nr:sigma-70 family RNA polymerase sigma factor [Acidimicrobiales bacterium]